MTVRIHKLKSPGYGVTWTVDGVKCSARYDTRAEAVAFRETLEAGTAMLPSSKRIRSDVAQEWQVRGGQTRQANMTPDERKAHAQHAARARWGNREKLS